MKWINCPRKSILSTFALGLLVIGQSADANNFSVNISDDDIAIDANNASLMELLQEIEKLTGIPVNFVAETKERVTINLGLTDIESAIGKITPNHMIVHETQDGKNIIKELIIIPADSDLAGSGSGSDFLPNGNPAPAIAQTPAGNDSNQTVPLPGNDPIDLELEEELAAEQAEANTNNNN